MTDTTSMDPPAHTTRDAVVVTCPTCASEFPVDPDRVPAAGVLAICSHCFRTFDVPPMGRKVPNDDADDAGAAGGPSSVSLNAPAEALSAPPPTGVSSSPPEPHPSPAPPPQPSASGTPLDAAAPDSPASSGEAAASSQAASVPTAPAAAPASPGSPTPPPPTGSPTSPSVGAGAARFGVRDPANRARRLARVLASDMITYNPARYSDARRSGRLREDFQDEIEKSWEEYVDQVGEDFASTTTHFADALNEVLAQGEQLFEGPGYPYRDA